MPMHGIKTVLFYKKLNNQSLGKVLYYRSIPVQLASLRALVNIIARQLALHPYELAIQHLAAVCGFCRSEGYTYKKEGNTAVGPLFVNVLQFVNIMMFHVSNI